MAGMEGFEELYTPDNEDEPFLQENPGNEVNLDLFFNDLPLPDYVFGDLPLVDIAHVRDIPPGTPDLAPTGTEEDTDETENTVDTADTADTAPLQVQRSKGNVGRRTTETTLLLQLFSRLNTEAKVKKEYLRVEILRGFKRSIRFAIEKRKPRKKIEGFEEGDRRSAALWTEFTRYVRKHKELGTVAMTISGPCTEGKAKRTPASEDAEKTFNDRYCRQFFAASEVREAYHLYLHLLFASKADTTLQMKFRFQPVASDLKERSEAWERLQEYLHNGMLRELNIPNP